ncbi:helix-turn-helix domain-containing protein [Treponema denticola]|uniref:helix-turn-helix domain-containing protein n=1 Tax=Treponema denticola TaxID=158 RepID=UPI0020A3CC4D|nr:helix-turn-helix domain-containing protein [Treponema denticola]UTC96112.1 helix-turn-helix domain-containing protein [Treponema denticola]
MNIYKKSLEEIEAFPELMQVKIDVLPNCPPILSPKEAAFVCNVSEPTIQRMISGGLLPVNSDHEILKKDLINYIKTHSLADIPLM